jgi:hypothetical protein
LPQETTPPVPTGQETGWVSELVWTQRLEENPSSISDAVLDDSVNNYFKMAVSVSNSILLKKCIDFVFIFTFVFK